MLLKFTKMHGAGNDFVVIDLISQRCRLRPQDVRRIADRHFGIGHFWHVCCGDVQC